MDCPIADGIDVRRLIRRRLAAEELTRQRRSDDLVRHAEVFRRSSIDANPHQLEAALFALERLDTGGALLCDEVGLGKTIETGIVLTQLRMSGRLHQLIVVPLTLAAQWQTELANLFSLPSRLLGAACARSWAGRSRWDAFCQPRNSRPPSAAVRGSLIHEFRHHSNVLVSTEAGAKGLNLQFCNCLINFDLPWNPQRVEQRIGRVHRYGQTRDVVIINCVNLDNEAEMRVYEILKDKLQLCPNSHIATNTIASVEGGLKPTR